MRRGTVIGAEALIRWNHPTRGLLPPAAFLATVDDSPLAVTLGEWVLRRAMTQLTFWAEQGTVLPLSVNISGRHLQHPDFVLKLKQLLDEFPRVEPHWLELEILETTAMDDVDKVSKIMHRCNALGVSFSLDDFGTGFASLTYFRRLPTQLVKIDRSFIKDILDDPDDLAIVEGVVGLARTFRRQVIAEGVETLGHGVPLLRVGCELAQGYAIARPMPAEEIPDWVERWQVPPEWAGAVRIARIGGL
jgi:EAL domain-containing protein (putative c-di-GMP-specific phosphodiesterase class I)